MRKINVITYILFGMALLPLGSLAQESVANFPSRPVTLVSGTAAGGPTENETRLYMTKLSQLMGQPFVIDFKAGGGQIIGANYVAKSTPNGYTVLIVTATFALNAAMREDLPFNVSTDFAPVSLMSIRSTVLLVNPSVPAKDVSEYIAYVRSNPGKLNYGSSGQGSAGHIAGAWLHGLTGSNVTFVNYKGAGPMMVDLIAGRVHVAMEALSSALPMIKSGKVRVLGITGLERSPILPQLRTVAEQALPGFDYSGFLGFSAPGGTPSAIVNKLSENFALTAKTPEIVKPMEEGGAVMIGSSPSNFKQLLDTQIIRWKKVVQDNGIKAE
jgi:tripartite-type tricarboxylate transporter receptor subunit TctC